MPNRTPTLLPMIRSAWDRYAASIFLFLVSRNDCAVCRNEPVETNVLDVVLHETVSTAYVGRINGKRADHE
jgi:hypothetical protein